MAEQVLGVLFLNKRVTPSGKEYYSGKTEGQDEFNLIAWINTSKAGKQYLTLKIRETETSEELKKSVEKLETDRKAEVDTNVDSNDLPF